VKKRVLGRKQREKFEEREKNKKKRSHDTKRRIDKYGEKTCQQREKGKYGETPTKRKGQIWRKQVDHRKTY
jgi:hypothetical protein